MQEVESGDIEQLSNTELAKILSDDSLDDVEGNKDTLFIPGERWMAEREVRELRREQFNGERECG